MAALCIQIVWGLSSCASPRVQHPSPPHPSAPSAATATTARVRKPRVGPPASSGNGSASSSVAGMPCSGGTLCMQTVLFTAEKAIVHGKAGRNMAQRRVRQQKNGQEPAVCRDCLPPPHPCGMFNALLKLSTGCGTLWPRPCCRSSVLVGAACASVHGQLNSVGPHTEQRSKCMQPWAARRCRRATTHERIAVHPTRPRAGTIRLACAVLRCEERRLHADVPAVQGQSSGSPKAVWRRRRMGWGSADTVSTL